ncbi:patatin-like phospholipase family protein [Alkaliphilus transvaalensis]|uniref:patatin-like phospholipase family protein n=1 Tax=Alkaliphilus transvaalensis TaxID=114628 RepID=UPI0004793766|nr:patatin-like phospholipase family protein [Alkaliphilus transvaalensis]
MLGLTLEGGGAKGAYQIGAWKAFRELNIEFDGISGTSVGALNGALMIQEDFELAYEIWNNMSPTKIMDVDDKIYELIADNELSPNSIQALYGEVKRVVKGFGIDPKPLRKLVNKCVKEDYIRKSNKHFGFVTVCLTERRPMEIYKEDVPLGKMADYLMASSYLPIFKSKKLDGKVFLDGGFYNNLPLEMLYKKGCKQIVAVRLLSKGRIKKVDYPDLEVIYITPNQPLGGIMEFSRDRARQNILLGYFDTFKALKGLKGRNYYINSGIDDTTALRFFMGLKEDSIKKLGDLFNLNQGLPINRLILEGIIPKFITLMELDKNCTYGDVLLGLVEAMAGNSNINPFEIYDVNYLLQKVITRRDLTKNDENPDLLGKFMINEIVLRLDKEKLLKEALKVILIYNENLNLTNY